MQESEVPQEKGNITKLAESIADKVVDSIESVGEKIHDLVLGESSQETKDIVRAPPEPTATIGDVSQVPLTLKYPIVNDPKVLMSMGPASMSLNPELQNEVVPRHKMNFPLVAKKGAEEQLLPITVDMSSTNLGTGKAARKGRKLPTRRHETKNVTKYVDPEILKKERQAPSGADLSSDI